MFDKSQGPAEDFRFEAELQEVDQQPFINAAMADVEAAGFEWGAF